MSESGNLPANVRRYAKYLLVMAGLGGLLYGIDVGVIAAALPYIQETSTYTPQQLSVVVAAVLFGSVLSSLFAGAMAEALGRKKVILLSALCFVASIPVICFSNNSFGMLMGGRILQGESNPLLCQGSQLHLLGCAGLPDGHVQPPRLRDGGIVAEGHHHAAASLGQQGGSYTRDAHIAASLRPVGEEMQLHIRRHQIRQSAPVAAPKVAGQVKPLFRGR